MTQDEAIQVAVNVLYHEIDIPDDDEIIPTRVERIDEGWYIECNSRIFMETDDPMYALVTAPIIVAHDGTSRFVF